MNVTCIFCDQQTQVAPDHAGSEITCPKCGKEFPLPSAELGRSRGRAYIEHRGSWWKPSLAGVISFLFHACLLSLFMLVTWSHLDPGGMGSEVRIGEMPSEELGEREEGELDAEAAEPVDQQTELEETFEEIAPPVPAADETAMEIDAFMLTPSGSAGGVPEMAVISGGGSSIGSGTSFMGSRAEGHRFCIVADCSGSMAEVLDARSNEVVARPLEYVKSEILETINSMHVRARFQVVFFSTEALPFPDSGWLHPRRHKEALKKWLSDVHASGVTEPGEAFKIAFQLEPKPDVIFFMTDGLFDEEVVDEVAKLNSGKKVVINTISFINRDSEPLMRAIAKDSGGRYRHVHLSSR